MSYLDTALKEVLERLSPTSVLVFLLVLALIYIWYQHHHSRILEERSNLVEEKRKSLAEELQKVLTKQEQAPRETSAASIKVLIVDDEDSICIFPSTLIRREIEAVETMTAADGLEALSKIRTISPSLVVLDLVMPRMTGFDLMRKIYEDHREIAMLVVTGYASSKSEVAKKSGIPRQAFRFMTKPFFQDDFIDTVRELIKK